MLPCHPAHVSYRYAIGADNLRYGAAYGPWLLSTYPRKIPGDVIAAAPKGLLVPAADVAACIVTRLSQVPPSGAVANLWCFIDLGAWHERRSPAFQVRPDTHEDELNADLQTAVTALRPQGHTGTAPANSFCAKAWSAAL